jgi:hypothetical protein
VRQLFERPLLEAETGERERSLAGAAALAADVLTGAPTTAVSASAAGPSASDPGYARNHGLYWLASNVSTDSPLAPVVDDLQWCDAPSARAPAFMARRLEGQALADPARGDRRGPVGCRTRAAALRGVEDCLPGVLTPADGETLVV